MLDTGPAWIYQMAGQRASSLDKQQDARTTFGRRSSGGGVIPTEWEW